MTQEQTNIIDQPELGRNALVNIEIAGKAYQVPEGITAIKALWYTGQEVVWGRGLPGRVLRSLRDVLSETG
jgi:hypothetical protein